MSPSNWRSGRVLSNYFREGSQLDAIFVPFERRFDAMVEDHFFELIGVVQSWYCSTYF